MPTAPPPLRAVWFDLDGTLLDTFEGLAATYRHALCALGRPEPDDAALRPCVGPPLRGNLARFLGDSDPVLVERAVTFFRERYDAVGWSESRPYDGVREMLLALRARGLPLFVATAKPQVYAERMLAHHGLLPLFDAAFGARLDAALDDKAVLLARALGETGVSASESALVGDRENDVTAARKNGVLPVGAVWGYGTAEELTCAGARVLCASPADVPRALAG